MKKGQRRQTRQAIKGMIELRIAGLSFKEIGRQFGVDHTTAIYHCAKAGLAKLKRIETINCQHLKLKQEIEKQEIKKIPQETERKGMPITYVDYVKKQKLPDAYKIIVKYQGGVIINLGDVFRQHAQKSREKKEAMGGL